MKSVFTKVASSYDQMNDAMSAGVHRIWKDDFTALAGLAASSSVIREFNASSTQSQSQSQSQTQSQPQPQSQSNLSLDILDVAGGTGDIAFRFVEQMEMLQHSRTTSLPDCCSVTVCDINPGMLSVGRQRAVEKYGSTLLDSEALKFVEGNAESLPFPDNSFDLYTISFGLRNVTDVPKALRDAYRVLKPGGRFMVLEFSEPVNEQFRAIYDAYSFNVIPKLGEVVAGDRDSYQYLVESIRKFYRQKELEEEVKKAGFTYTKYVNYTNGLVAVHEGWKL